MDWFPAFTITFTIIGVLGGFMLFISQRMKKGFDRINTSIDASNRRLDTHAQRIDQLYCIIVDMLKERK